MEDHLLEAARIAHLDVSAKSWGMAQPDAAQNPQLLAGQHVTMPALVAERADDIRDPETVWRRLTLRRWPVRVH